MRLKIILKKTLKLIPFFGWAMQCLLFIFLSRNRENDLPHIANSLLYLLTSSYTEVAPCILYFPEGTDLSESNKKKSNEFAESKNLPPLKYVLYPKTAGFSVIANTLSRYYTAKQLPKELVSALNYLLTYLLTYSLTR
jgi:lysocardiolipin and lysophospholipid acyltransferase